jgi:hypothetical protein
MIAWINITEADLRDTKASALVDAFASAALGDGQTDPVPRTIIKVCDRIRAEIQSSKKYQVSATPHSIPPSLVELAGNLIAWRMQSRLNVLNAVPITDQDKIDHSEDLAYLKRIAEGKVTIEVPDNPETVSEVQSGGPIVETIGDRPRQTGREASSRL